MPGYQTVKIVQPSAFAIQEEPIYGHIKTKKKSSKDKQHPLFADLRSRDVKDHLEVDRYLRGKDAVRRNNYKMDGLRIMGSCNDIPSLSSTLAIRQRNLSIPDENVTKFPSRQRAKSPSVPKGEKKHSIPDASSLTSAMITSLRNSASENNLYESVEMIHYLKTMKSLNRQKKTRSIQRTGHPLFDALREEQAMKEPLRKNTPRKPLEDHVLGMQGFDYLSSDGNSPSLSPSSSGDEYDTYPRGVIRSGGRVAREQYPQPLEVKFANRNIVIPIGLDNNHPTLKRAGRDSYGGSESDEDFKMIPRPKFMGRTNGPHKNYPMPETNVQKHHSSRRRSELLSPSDESDSSFNSSAGLR